MISTVIPSGTTIPHAAYSSWASEVDSQLQIVLDLYRGTNQASANNYYLGRFEVLGVPPPPAKVHVQVAYVLANQQILLGAYDDKRKVFLEIHRVDNSSTK
jgi:molecular chaperone DnaK (HSP70)